MNVILKYGIVASAGALAYHFWSKRRASKMYSEDQMEEVQKNIHLLLEDIYEGKASQQDIESAVIDLTNV